MLQQQGRALEIVLLAESTPEAHWEGEDFNRRGWGVALNVDPGFYGRLTDEELEGASESLKEALSRFFNGLPHDDLWSVKICPRIEKSPQWREQAARFVRGEGVSNQGRVRSDNVAAKGYDGLLFRSQPEIEFFKALKARKDIVFAPLPVLVRGGPRLEPDFVLFKDGIVMVVEVDGDTYHRESPAEAHGRLQPLYDEGVLYDRVQASQCNTPEKAVAAVERVLKGLARQASLRGR